MSAAGLPEAACHPEGMRLTVPEGGLVDGDVTLRVPRPDDVDRIYEVVSTNRDITYWTRIPWPYERVHAREHVQRAPALFAAGTDAPFAVVDSISGVLLGSVGLHKLGAALDPRSALLPNEIGYWLAPDARGRGICTRAVRLLVNWAFGTLDLDRVWLSVVVGNEVSRRVAERAGFVHVRDIAENECCDDLRALRVFTRARDGVL